MPGIEIDWPAWPEFGPHPPTESKTQADPNFLEAKRQVIEEYGKDALTKSWLGTCAELEEVTDEIVSKGRDIIPRLQMEEIKASNIPEATKAELRRIGCFIIDGVIPQEEAHSLFQALRSYTTRNKGKYSAWPVETPSIFNLYNTPTQNALRTHPNQLRVMRWINELWHTSSDDPEVSAEPLLYADGVRMRPPGQAFLGLGPHIDAGSLARWADAAYRKTYAAIFSGMPEEHDCYDADARKDANQALFPAGAHSSVFRAFQGWTALTHTAPREGTIRLYPNVKAVISYVLLRPFFRPPEDPSAILDATAWTFDPDESWFPGTFKDQSQYLSDSSHPHLRLKECLLHIPELQPGDTVCWHSDVSSRARMILVQGD